MYWNESDIHAQKGMRPININMRCIEIWPLILYLMVLLWLTLTWDVLKLDLKTMNLFPPLRLTLTWDVLKFAGENKGG